jgi:EF-P beta-lysylation protein EpmB
MNHAVSWREIQKQNFTRLHPLLEFLQIPATNFKNFIEKPRFVLNLPIRLAEKINKNDLTDPILRQFLPLSEENIFKEGYLQDPVDDQRFRKSKKLLHKYFGRALLITTSACAMHCRFCFRQNFPYETAVSDFEEEIQYIENAKDLEEIILSGGDPLSLSDATLKNLFDRLNSINHVKRIRFHTRFPIGIPERITPEFLSILDNCSKQIFFVIHVNHLKELDEDIFHALKKIQKLGIPVFNQSTLLKGVNDEEVTYFQLCKVLVNHGIIPYYLHLLDPVQGAFHFDTSEEKAKQILRYIQTHLSGYAVPKLAREIPGRQSKTLIDIN